MTAIDFPYQGLSSEAPHLGGYVTNYEHTGTWAPNVLFELFQKVKPSSVTDIGCGAGHVAQWFHDRNCHVIGVDGCTFERIDFDRVVHDYAIDPLPILKPRDLAIAFEFVEHVREEHFENWMATVNAHRWFAMTHATPGQPGHHHVNCQPPSYWIRKLAHHGWKLDVEFSLDARALVGRANDAARCIKNSFLLFERQT